MRCPVCHHVENRVLESRAADAGQSVRRRRECLECGHRFTTYERIEFAPLMVVKRGGDREVFDPTKISQGVAIACEKTEIQFDQVTQLVEAIANELQQRPTRDIPSSEIGELVLQHLQPLSEVAYIRFASVHQSFQSIQDFLEILHQFNRKRENEVTPKQSDTQSDETSNEPLEVVGQRR
jgi:transcriptional repressor NrdR